MDNCGFEGKSILQGNNFGTRAAIYMTEPLPKRKKKKKTSGKRDENVKNTNMSPDQI